MKTVFLYAGQGSQKVGMGEDFYKEYKSYAELVDGLKDGEATKKLMHEGPMEELSKTEHTQRCMAVFAAGVTALLKENGIYPEAACGLSLGEYGALYAADVFSAEDYIRLVTFRGEKMMEAARGCDCCMSAVLSLESAVICRTCEEYDGEGYVTVANFNCPGQTVICGDEVAVSAVEEKLRALGAKKIVRLAVSGPFHTKFMKKAGDALQSYFQDMQMKKPEIPVTSNVTGGFYGETDDIRELLVRQVQESVHLEDDLRALLNAGYENFVEIGPGNTMAGFLKRTAREMKYAVQVQSIETADDFRKVIETWA